MQVIYPLKHFKLITTHKWYVFKNCCKVGLPVRGFLHDFSKYSPKEFCESMKYYTGKKSPIDTCKEQTGMSKAWLHHKGKNPHHWEYWIDDIDDGGENHPKGMLMPYKFATEMLCDYIGAGQAYKKSDWTPAFEWEWWQNKKQHCVMHPIIKDFITLCLYSLKESNSVNVVLNSRFTKWAYNYCKENYNDLVRKWNV